MPEENSAQPVKYDSKPPAPLNLSGNKVESWKLFKKRWTNYETLSGIGKAPREVQVAMFENCLDDEALRVLDGFAFDTPENQRTVKELTTAFESYALGDIHETLERYKFGRRDQQEGEPIDTYISTLRSMLKTCDYCNTCEPSILRDRIILGIQRNDTREELLKQGKLNLTRCIEICRASETAINHGETLKHYIKTEETVNKVNIHNSGEENKDCIFCTTKHPLKYKFCPAWGKYCNKCGEKNHFEARCDSLKRRNAGQRSKQRMRHIEEDNYTEQDTENQSDYDYCANITTRDKKLKAIKHRMSVEGKDVDFLIDTGASVNVLPSKYATQQLEPYEGKLLMWNNSETQPKGQCRLKLINLKTSKKYSVPFLVIQGNNVPTSCNP